MNMLAWIVPFVVLGSTPAVVSLAVVSVPNSSDERPPLPDPDPEPLPAPDDQRLRPPAAPSLPRAPSAAPAPEPTASPGALATPSGATATPSAAASSSPAAALPSPAAPSVDTESPQRGEPPDEVQSEIRAPAQPSRVVTPSTPPLAPNRRVIAAHRWYGWQLLIGDAATLAVLAATEDWQAGLLYPLVGVVVHTAHGYPGRGFGSLGIRIGGAATAAVAAAATGSVVPSVVVMLAAELIDLAALSHERPGDEVWAPKLSAAPEELPLTMVPVVAPARGGGLIGLAAMF